MCGRGFLIKKYLFVVFIVTIKTSFAQLPHIYALHINGIDTTLYQARANLVALRLATQLTSNMVTWDVVYNPTGSDQGKTLIANLWDVMQQKAKENYATMSLDDFTDFYISQFPDQCPPTICKHGTPQYIAFENQISNKYESMLINAAGVNFPKILDEFHEIVPPQFASVISLMSSKQHNKQQISFIAIYFQFVYRLS